VGLRNGTDVEGEHEQSPDFCRFSLSQSVFLVLTFLKAALFIAIVTSFILEALPDLKNLSTSNRPSSILMISGFWFMSIMSSLAATIWAIICLEWCAFLTDVTKAEDYEEVVEKRQCQLEAIQRWRMGLIIATVPLFLHFSLFAFLAGLWLRLRDINKEIALLVGVPSLIMASTYTTTALLPIFTTAPFFTSASKIIRLAIRGTRCIIRHCRFIRPPRLIAWMLGQVFRLISTLFQALRRIALSLNIPHLWTITFTSARSIFGKFASYLVSVWQTFIRFLPFILPTYVPDPPPFNELNALKFGPLDLNKQIRLRALVWLMNTPLTREEVKNILEEFRLHFKTAVWKKSLDRSRVIKLLVSSLSSLLANNDISPKEELIFRHCTEILADEIEKAFRNGGDLRGIHFWKSTQVLEKLLPYFRLDEPSDVLPIPSGEDLTHSYTTPTEEEDYWLQKAVPALLFCPLPRTVKMVVTRFDSTKHLTKETLLRIVHGPHVANLACTDSKQSIVDKIPDLGFRGWGSRSLDLDLDRALLQFLRNLFETPWRDDYPPTTPCPTTTPSLVVSCLKILDEEPDRYHPKIHNALCLLVVVAWRCDPLAFEGEPSSTDDLLSSARSYSSKGSLENARRLVARLRAIACGPKDLVYRNAHPLVLLGNFFSGLHHSIVEDEQCLRGFLEAYTATLEAVLSMDGPPATVPSQRNPSHPVVEKNASSESFFTHRDPLAFARRDLHYRLSYLYSLAIALTLSVQGWNDGFFNVAEFLVTREEARVTLDTALDINILAVAVLEFAALSQPELMKDRLGGALIERVRRAIIKGTNWRTRWKSIYFIAGVASLLFRIGMLEEAKEFLTKEASKALERVKSEPPPSDWRRKEKGLEHCGLLHRVQLLVGAQGEPQKGVYEWNDRHGVPHLALYHLPPNSPKPCAKRRWTFSKIVTVNKWQVQSAIKRRTVLMIDSQEHYLRWIYGPFRKCVVDIQRRSLVFDRWCLESRLDPFSNA
jgi:hypothetical protein